MVLVLLNLAEYVHKAPRNPENREKIFKMLNLIHLMALLFFRIPSMHTLFELDTFPRESKYDAGFVPLFLVIAVQCNHFHCEIADGMFNIEYYLVSNLLTDPKN